MLRNVCKQQVNLLKTCASLQQQVRVSNCHSKICKNLVLNFPFPIRQHSFLNANMNHLYIRRIKHPKN